MRLWMIWAVLSVIWGLQAAAAVLVHNRRYAITMFAMAAFFALIGYIVRGRTAGQPTSKPKSR